MSDKNAQFFADSTQTIIEAMEKAKTSKKPFLSWNSSFGFPTNAATGSKYNGVNVLLLTLVAQMHGFTRNKWMTVAQGKKMGYYLKKGETCKVKVTFYTPLTFTDKDTNKERSIVYLKPYCVFNVDQFNGYPVEQENIFVCNNEKAEAMLQIADIRYGMSKAYYINTENFIGMPKRGDFNSIEDFYHVGLHELTHWTRHPERLNRKRYSEYEREAYAFEELVAEIGASFLCADVGIIQNTLEDHAMYLDSWIKALKNDTQLIFKAAKYAQQAFEYIQAEVEQRSKGIENLGVAA